MYSPTQMKACYMPQGSVVKLCKYLIFRFVHLKRKSCCKLKNWNISFKKKSWTKILMLLDYFYWNNLPIHHELSNVLADPNVHFSMKIISVEKFHPALLNKPQQLWSCLILSQGFTVHLSSVQGVFFFLCNKGKITVPVSKYYNKTKALNMVKYTLSECRRYTDFVFKASVQYMIP